MVHHRQRASNGTDFPAQWAFDGINRQSIDTPRCGSETSLLFLAVTVAPEPSGHILRHV
jgi:hypothetical protein